MSANKPSIHGGGLLITPELSPDAKTHIDAAAVSVHANAIRHDWWTAEGRNDGELIALIHSELSEMLEALRDGDQPSTVIPPYSRAEEEAADALIRLLDMCAARGYRIGGALAAKHYFNIGRPIRHGGKAF